MVVSKLSPQAKILLVLLILTGIVFRWTMLDIRPLHHDESIHVMFGKYFLDDPENNYYKYNPEYHGPLLYTTLRIMYKLFGQNEKAARGIAAFMGSLLLFLPLLCRKYLTEKALIVVTAALAISPTLIFWSRFVREDSFVFFGMALILYGVLAAPPRLKSFFVMFGIVFQYASKENSYVTLALFWAFCVFEFVWRRYIDKKNEPVPCTLFAPLPFAAVLIFRLGIVATKEDIEVIQYDAMHIGALCGALLIGIDVFRKCWKEYAGDASIVVRLYRHIGQYRAYFIGAFLLASGFFWYLFTAGGRYEQGLLDGLYEKGITYWIVKHASERIKGPFLFHFYTLSWYELFFMAAVFIHAVHFYLSHGKLFKYLGIGALSAALLTGFFSIPHDAIHWQEPTFFVWKLFKLKDWFDITGFIILILHPALVTFGHIRDKDWNLTFFGYWFTATFFTYSYLGEKVPWLSAYPFLAGLCYFPMYWMAVQEGRVGANVSAAQVLKAFGVLIIAITVVFIPVYFFITKEPANSLFNDYPQLLAQGGGCIVFGMLLLLCSQIEFKKHFFDTPVTFWLTFAVYAVFTLRIAYMVNFIPQYFELGYISQVHTTSELVTLAHNARAEAEKPGGDKNRRIMVTGDGSWPLVWYFKNLPAYSFSENGNERSSFYYVFQNTDAPAPPEFNKTVVHLRGWWVPDFREMTLSRFLDLSLNLQTWGGYGYSDIAYLERK